MDALDRAEILADAKAFIRWAKGDPTLSSWEANFIHGVGELLEDNRIHKVSPKQRAVLTELAQRLGWGTDAPVSIPEDSIPEDSWA